VSLLCNVVFGAAAVRGGVIVIQYVNLLGSKWGH